MKISQLKNLKRLRHIQTTIFTRVNEPHEMGVAEIVHSYQVAGTDVVIRDFMDLMIVLR